MNASLNQHQLLEPLQAGFCKHHSYKTAVVNVVDGTGSTIGKNNIAFLILIEFDIDGKLFSRSKISYLYSDGQYPDECIISERVPQSSIAGHTLFPMFAGTIVKDVNPHFYADDN